jgi:quinol monooxygenase YgiN
MGQFEVRARLKIREGQLEGFKRQAAEIMRQAWEKDTGTVAYDWFLSTDGTECEVREAYVDADAFVEHTVHVREARDTLFAEFAYDYQMTIYGEPSPRLVELFDRVRTNVTWFTLLQAHGGDIRIS